MVFPYVKDADLIALTPADCFIDGMPGATNLYTRNCVCQVRHSHQVSLAPGLTMMHITQLAGILLTLFR